MLVAREQELDEILAALASSRLTTLTGPGGVGKTSLARAVLAKAEADGRPVMFADLAAVDGDRLASAVVGDLGFPSLSAFVEHLKAASATVLVIDNCEHVIDEISALVTHLLDTDSDLTILTTSRERLDLQDERVVPIAPLSIDGPGCEAQIMFEAVARRQGTVDLGDDATLTRLVRRLDGLPLAIELAAARTVALTPSEILRHLEAKLDILSRARQRGPQRQQSLQATIEWSYQLLSDQERRMMARLSVIPPPFTSEMALAVGAAEDLNALVRLVEQSLVVRETQGRRSWYRLLDTIRVYAAEQLTAVERDEAEQQLIEFLQLRTREWQREFRDGEPELLTELRQTFRCRVWAIDRLLDRDDVDGCLHLVSGMGWLEDSGHHAEVVEVIERVLRDQEFGDGNAEAHATLAVMYRIAGRNEECRAAARQVLVGGNDVAKAFAHRALGLLTRGEGRWEEAEHHFTAGSDAARLVGNVELDLEIVMHLAVTRWRSGDVDGARSMIEDLRRRSASLPQADAWIAVVQSLMHLDQDPEWSRDIACELASSEAAASDSWVAGWCAVVLAIVELLEKGDDGLLEAARLLAVGLEHFVDIRNRTDIVQPLLVASAIAFRAGLDEAGWNIAATAHHAYPRIVMGPAEQRLLERIGGPHAVEEGRPQMAPVRVVELLRGLAESTPVQSTGEPDASPGNVFRRDGDSWLVIYRGRTSRLRDSKGMATLARLLSRPEVEMAAVDLMDASVVELAADVVADSRARDAYRDRVRELQSDIDDAAAHNDPARGERARMELDRLITELETAYGLSGSERSTSSTAERARSAVRWRLRDAIDRIDKVHPALGAHLDRSISTGRFCSYRPVDPTIWTTG